MISITKNNIKVLRVRKKICQEDLAKRASISRVYLSKVENSISSPSIKVCMRLAKALDCTVDEIFF